MNNITKIFKRYREIQKTGEYNMVAEANIVSKLIGIHLNLYKFIIDNYKFLIESINDAGVIKKGVKVKISTSKGNFYGYIKSSAVNFCTFNLEYTVEYFDEKTGCNCIMIGVPETEIDIFV